VMFTERVDGSFHRRTGRETVVHDDDYLAPEREVGAIAVIGLVPAFEFDALTFNKLFDARSRNAEFGDDVVTEHADIPGGDRADREFRMARRAEFSDEKDVERCEQSPNDFEPHRQSAARERKHYDVVAISVRRQERGEPLSSFVSIAKSDARQTDLLPLLMKIATTDPNATLLLDLLTEPEERRLMWTFH